MVCSTPRQFDYRTNRSVHDATNMGLHYIHQQLDTCKAYVGFHLWTSALSSTPSFQSCRKQAGLLQPAALRMTLDYKIPTNRKQYVRLGCLGLLALWPSVLGFHKCVCVCVRFPLLFSLYTSNYIFSEPSVKFIPFAVDIILISHSSKSDESGAAKATWNSLHRKNRRLTLGVNVITLNTGVRCQHSIRSHFWPCFWNGKITSPLLQRRLRSNFLSLLKQLKKHKLQQKYCHRHIDPNIIHNSSMLLLLGKE